MTMQYTFENETGRRTDAALCGDCAEYHEEYPEFGSMLTAEALPEWRCDGVTLARGRACINA